MVRLRGRRRRGERLLAKAPFGHGKTTAFTAGLRRNGLVAPFVLDGPMNGEAFRVYVEKIRVPPLVPDDIAAMDNLPAHKVEGVRTLIADAGAELCPLPTCSPDLNPIEMAFSQVKNRICERPPSEPRQRFGTASANASTKSPRKPAPTISPRPHMRHRRRQML
jgi:transposase